MRLSHLFTPNARFASGSYRADVDGLRALAVLSVILYHLQVTGFGGGYVGVDMFYVISGYLVSQIVWKASKAGNFSFLHFYERRIRRLAPSALALMVVATIGATLVLSITDIKAYGGSLLSGVGFVANIYFYFHSGYFEADVSNKPLLHLWSLGVEMQFYLLWPLILSLLADYMPGKRSPIIIGAIAVLSLLCAILMQGPYSNASFYLLPARMYEFLMGASLLFVPPPKAGEAGRNLADCSFLGGLTMIAISVLLYTVQTPFPAFYALLPCVGTALLIYGAPHSILKPVLANPVMAYIGRISYELYLFHWIAIVYYKYVDSEVVTTLDMGIMMVATAVFAMLTYHLVSFPLRYGFKKTKRQRQGFILACIAVALLLAGLGASMRESGWAWRLPAETQLFADDPETFHATRFGGIGYHENQLLTLGDTSTSPQFLLLGDSFAGQYAAALDAFLKEEHRSAYLFHVNACLFMPHGTAQMTGQTTDACNGAFDRMMPVLLNNHLPVILAQSWSSYKNSVTNADGSRINFPRDTNDEYYAFIVRNIDAMRQALSGHKLVIVGISPGIAEQKSLARCFEVPNYIPTHCAEHAAAPEESRQNGQEFNRAAANYGALHPEVGFINPRTAMCVNGMCYAISDSKIYYSDFSHFTKDGARRVIEQYRDLILSLHP